MSSELARAAAENIQRLAKEKAELIDALSIILTNATIIPDPAMDGATDCYRVSLDDIESARAAIAAATGGD